MTGETGAEPWEQLYRYWLSKNVDGRPPARADLDPLIEIPHLIPHLMILEILPDGYRYRLVGSDIRDRLGAELTGTQVGQSSVAETKWWDLLDRVKQEQKPVVVTTEMPLPSVGKRLAVVLPLVDPSGVTERIMAGVFFGSDFRPGMTIGPLTALDLKSK